MDDPNDPQAPDLDDPALSGDDGASPSDTDAHDAETTALVSLRPEDRAEAPAPPEPEPVIEPSPEPPAGSLQFSPARKALIQRIEAIRSARVLVYMDAPEGDPDVSAIRYVFEHLRGFHGRSHDRIALVLGYRASASADVHAELDFAARLIALIREYAREVEVLVPNSALGVGTFLALGADRILMHPLGTLGGVAAAEALAVPRAYLAMVREAGLDADGGDRAALEALNHAIGPAELGRRRYAVTRLQVGLRELVAARVQRRRQAQNQALLDALYDPSAPLARMVDRRRAKDALGLPVESINTDLETVLWELFSTYERGLGWSRSAPLGDDDSARAVIESAALCHARDRHTWRRIVRGEVH